MKKELKLKKIYHYMKNRSEVINLSKIGDITLVRSKLAKHIRISIKPPSTIRVAVPVGVSFKEAHNFVISKEAWLLRQIQRLSKSKINSLYKKCNFLRLYLHLCLVQFYNHNQNIKYTPYHKIFHHKFLNDLRYEVFLVFYFEKFST